eukprot:scaffold3453_cov73-Cylindrotheca_fusiformis.AAC.2
MLVINDPKKLIICYVSVFFIIKRRVKYMELPILAPKMVLYIQPMQHGGKMKHFKNKQVKQSSIRQERCQSCPVKND